MLKATKFAYQDHESRTWYDVIDSETLTYLLYALTSDNRILDYDGAPMTESDPETIAVRNAIESVIHTIDELNEFQLVHGENGYSVVRYTDVGAKYYAFAGRTEDEARATDSRILESPVVKVSDDDVDRL